MKSLKIFSICCLSLAVTVIGCRKKKDDRSILTGNEIASVISATPDSLILMMDKADEEAVKISFSETDWKFPANNKYQLQMLNADSANWSKAHSIELGTNLSGALTHFELTDIAIKQGIAAGTYGKMLTRVRAYIPGTSQEIFSASKTTVIMPYALVKPNLSSTPGSTSIIMLEKAKATEDAVNMTWSEVNWANPSTTSYNLEVIADGGDWKTAKVFELAGLTAAKFSHKGLNNLLLNDFGANPGDTVKFISRIKAYVAGTSRVSYSDAINNSAVPYDPNSVANKIYFPGAYQGWGPWPTFDLTTLANIEETAIGSGAFKGYVEFTGNGVTSTGFKITPEPNWDYDFGDAGTNYSDPKSGSGKIGPKSKGTNGPDFNLPAGTYYLQVDTVTENWSYELRNWGIIGDATNSADVNGDGTADGWQSDKNMRFNPQTRKFEITLNLENGKEIKFRQNDDWTVNLGDNGADGSLEPSGANMKISDGTGNYLVTFDPANNTYTVTKQ
jgi:starch-binding outer membrane protein SusE/F